MTLLLEAEPMLNRTPPDPGVKSLLARYFQAVDDKNWQIVRECLCGDLLADDSLSRDVPASTLSADRYVERCRFALQAGGVRHTFFNLRVELDAESKVADARCSYIIHRFHSSPVVHDHFHAYGHYGFGFVKVDGGWKIFRIAQTVLRHRENRVGGGQAQHKT